jgi:ATP-dependent Clp protease adapter protein ClpS
VERLSSLPTIIEKPEVDAGGPGTGSGGHWIVTVYDNDYNSIEQVILILIKATNCTLSEAEIETWEIHTLGRSVVHHGEEEECRKAADVIAEIGIRVEVSEE